MKTPHLFPFAAAIVLAASGCDKRSSDVSGKISELERKNEEAAARQRELEQELEQQKLATEREAIERERMQIEDERAELERREGEAAAAEEEALRQREQQLSDREGRLERVQSEVWEKEDDIASREQKLSEREQDLAGREALPFDSTPQVEPVADYGTFYDSLSSYGSWFETADYGYVWQPVVVRDSNWRPYSRGRWVCSDRGWTWVSDEPFGWATYHYGRWALLRGRGWVWVPGSEWAPSWVSWRESGSHIGWAPLPPETMAYTGHSWDSGVDTQFGIGAPCYTFVETRYFGGPIYQHCLPVGGNTVIIHQTTCITLIQVHNRQVICGGPRYRDVCERLGRPMPFYRLQMDQHPRLSRDRMGQPPRIRGNHLVVTAPNVDMGWNDGLRPKRVKGRIDSVTVERERNLSGEIVNRYRQTRQEGRQRAEEKIAELGGPERFESRREEKLKENRRRVDPGGRGEEGRGGTARNDREEPQRPAARPVRGNERPGNGGNIATRPDRREEQAKPEGAKPRVLPAPNTEGGPRVIPPREENGGNRQPQRPATRENREELPKGMTRGDEERERQQEQARERQEQQREQSGQRQQEENRRQQERAQRQQAQEENNRQQEQERAQRQQGQEENNRQQEGMQRQQQERAQRQREQEENNRQQERAQRQQEQEENRRQQEQAARRQQEEMQRQQERAQRQQEQEENRRQQEQAQRQQEEMQRQQERAQRQQEENQRQQEQARRQQEENNRQQQEQRRQQEENQRKQKEDEDRRGRGR